MVDASPRLDRLYLCLAAAGLILCLGVLICGPVASTCLQFSLPIATLLTSFALYFLPLTFLAVTGPFVTRVLTHSTASVGGQIGKLSAVSTIGSVLGAILISYLLIPYFSNSATMFATAGALFVLVLSYFIAFRRPAAGAVALLTTGLAIGAVGVFNQRHFKNATELYLHNSSFGQMQVVDLKDGSRRLYLNDFLVQNTFDPATGQSLSMFTYMLHGLARTYRTNISQVLCLGLGVGIVPMNFAREGARVDVVEINASVIPLAERYFGLEPAKLNITIGDARYYLNRTEKKYDAIILDAFLGDSSPSHLMTREAFASIRKALVSDGVLVINSFGDFSPGNDFMVASLDKTLQSVFKSVRIHAASSTQGNVFFVASDNPSLAFSIHADPETIPELVRSLVLDAFDSNRGTDDRSGRVLTDDYNPVDYFDAKNREENRRRLALSITGL